LLFLLQFIQRLKCSAVVAEVMSDTSEVMSPLAESRPLIEAVN